MVQSAINLGNNRKFRAYIGTGSDGSSEGPLAIEVEIEPQDTKARFRSTWRDYVKTVWTKYGDVCVGPSLSIASRSPTGQSSERRLSSVRRWSILTPRTTTRNP